MTLCAAFLRVLAGIAAAGVCGWTVARFFTAELTRREKAAWSLAAGLLVHAILLLVLLACRFSPGAGAFLAVDAIALSISLRVRPLRRAALPIPARHNPRDRLVILLLWVVAGGAFAIFLVEALSEPMWSTDFLAIWGFKGKVAYLTGTLPGRLFHDPALAWAHREYPLLVPLSLATLAFIGGAWNDQALAFLFPVCELATLLALSGFLARRVSPLAGAGAAALCALCFFLYRAVNAGTAEIPFALGAVLAASTALDFLAEDAKPTRARLAAAALYCASLKQEGSLFVVLLAGMVWWRSRAPRPKRLAAVALLCVPPAIHWGLLYLLRGSQTRRDFDLTLFEPRRWLELPPLFLLVIGRMLGTEARQAIVPLSAIALYLLITRRGIADPLMPVFAVQILCYAVAFSVSSFDPLYAIEGAFRRITMTLFPAFTLILFARLPYGAPAWAHQSSEPEAIPVSGDSSALPKREAGADHGGGTRGKSRKWAES